MKLASILKYSLISLMGFGFFYPIASYAVFNDAAFSTGSGFSGALLKTLVSLIIAGFFYIWAAWFAWGNYKAFTTGQIDSYTLTYNLLRVGIVLILIVFVLS
jgi:integrating conjugative element protein (TIGR03758 family)